MHSNHYIKCSHYVFITTLSKVIHQILDLFTRSILCRPEKVSDSEDACCGEGSLNIHSLHGTALAFFHAP